MMTRVPATTQGQTMKVTADEYFAIIPESVLFNPDLSDRAVRVYGVLRRFADDTGAAFPSHSTIAKRCGSSVPTVKRAIEELIGAEVLAKHLRFDDSGRKTSNGYHIISTHAQVTDDPYVQVTDDPGVQVTDDPRTKAIKNQSHKNEKEPEFAQFWSLYPRKVDKGHARRAFASALTRASLDDILRGTDALAALAVTADPQFIPYPATWLNGDRWEDVATEPPEPTVPAYVHQPPASEEDLAAFAEGLRKARQQKESA